jgi:hypothetical protein
VFPFSFFSHIQTLAPSINCSLAGEPHRSALCEACAATPPSVLPSFILCHIISLIVHFQGSFNNIVKPSNNPSCQPSRSTIQLIQCQQFWHPLPAATLIMLLFWHQLLLATLKMFLLLLHLLPVHRLQMTMMFETVAGEPRAVTVEERPHKKSKSDNGNGKPRKPKQMKHQKRPPISDTNLEK